MARPGLELILLKDLYLSAHQLSKGSLNSKFVCIREIQTHLMSEGTQETLRNLLGSYSSE